MSEEELLTSNTTTEDEVKTEEPSAMNVDVTDDKQKLEDVPSSKKEEIFDKLKEMLQNASAEDMGKMTVKSVREDLTKLFGDEVKEYKSEIRSAIAKRYEEQEAVEEEIVDDESGESEQEEDTEDEEDEQHPDVAALPEEWKAEFETVVWVKTHKQYPWWPSLIYDPSALSRKLKMIALKHLGKKHAVYYYGSNDWDNATPKQMKPFLENLEEFSAQKVLKKFKASFEKGVELAKKELDLPKEKRASWNHKQRKKPARKKTVSKPQPVTVSKVKATKSSKKTGKATQSKKKKAAVTVKDKDDSNEPMSRDDNNADEKSHSENEEINDADEDDEEEFKLDEVDDEEEVDEDYVEGQEEKKTKKKKKSKADDKDTVKSKKKRRRSENDKKETSAEGEDLPAKKKKLSDDEKVKKKKKKEKKEKDDNKVNKKRKASSTSEDKPLTSVQKKKLLEQKNAEEKNRIIQMKSSSEPVWKQVRDASSSSSASAPSKQSAPQDGRQETALERATRLTKLVDIHIKKEEKKGEQFDCTGIIKMMRKFKSINLTFQEWKETHFIEMLNTLRKYPHSQEIAKEAKEIRTFLKSKMSGDITSTTSNAPASTASDGKLHSSAKDSRVENHEYALVSHEIDSDHRVIDEYNHGKYHDIAIRLITDGQIDNKQGASLPLSNPDAKAVVEILESVHNPDASKLNFTNFMCDVHKVAFEIYKEENAKVLCRLRGLSKSSEDTTFITSLSKLSVSKWKDLPIL